MFLIILNIIFFVKKFLCIKNTPFSFERSVFLLAITIKNYIFFILAALGPFSDSTTSNSTLSPSERDLKPSD